MYTLFGNVQINTLLCTHIWFHKFNIWKFTGVIGIILNKRFNNNYYITILKLEREEQLTIGAICFLLAYYFSKALHLFSLLRAISILAFFILFLMEI